MATATLTGNKASLLSSTTVIARRTFLKFIRTPQLVVVGTVQGAMFLLIFRYVFGGAIQAGGVSYVNFLVPGFITTGIIWQGMMSAGAIAEDLDQGFFDRLRSLPIPRACWRRRCRRAWRPCRSSSTSRSRPPSHRSPSCSSSTSPTTRR